ncbi:MAG: hypothetical protein R3321_00665 [Nitrososphaeraceae archaeon]|nr:hypothetical protein [Nitrososphaeraceae archaeon]
MKIVIQYNNDTKYHEMDLPDHTKHFYYNPSSEEISIDFYDQSKSSIPANPAVPTTSTVHKGVSSPPEELEEDNDVSSIEEILDNCDGSVFASAAYIDKNPLKMAEKITNIYRGTANWRKMKKLANRYSCVYDLKDLDACDNTHLSSLLNYYIKDSKKIEELLTDVGKRYGLPSRSQRFNYAAYETLERVRKNGNGSYYTEEDFLKPVNDRMLITYQLTSIFSTFSYHTKCFRWVSSMGFYFFSKFVFDLIDDSKLEFFNSIPDGFYEANKELAKYIVELEKSVSKDYQIPPKGIFQTVADKLYPIMERILRRFIPGFTIDLKSVDYDEFASNPPRLQDALKYKMDATLYARKLPGYSSLWSKLKVLPGIGEYNISTRSEDLRTPSWWNIPETISTEVSSIQQ